MRRRPGTVQQRPWFATCVVALAVLAGGCSDSDARSDGRGADRGPAVTSTTAPTDRGVYPGTQWATTTATEAGMDQAALDRIAADAQAGGSNCLLVTRAGKLVDERYWNGTGADSVQEVWSATKSFTSTLVGMAQADGDLSIDDRASKYIPQWNGTPSESVTVRNLLSNDSGRHYDQKTDYGDMAALAPDKTAFAIGLGQDAPPGTVWRYNNSAIQTLSAVLLAATGRSASDLAADRLLAPIGMTHSRMTQDRAGNALTFMGLQSTCRDMARYGYLMLRRGRWNDTQVVPSAWVDEATRPSQSLNGNYGYLWWLNRSGDGDAASQAAGAGSGAGGQGRPIAPGAPTDMYFALGLGGQVIAIDPGTDTVVVRLAPTNKPAGATEFRPADVARVATQAVTRR
jgi:CubicO group peptidase (beta-lactamase class C family)